MNNPFDELERALSQARELQRAVDQHASSMAKLIRGHLREVPCYVLNDLKKELRGYNIHTGTWKP